MKRRRRDTESTSLSFLDAISSGFGAIVLLLVIVKVAEPTVIKERGTGLEELAEELAAQLPQLEMQLESLRKELADARDNLSRTRQRIARLAPQAAAQAEARAEAELDERAAATIETRLAAARQELTEEMQRLQRQSPRPVGRAVAGIPVDSEYIIFVIDTSGSMQSIWPTVMARLEETLNAYPRVRGIQVMSDMGEYLFSQYAGQWIPDTPGRRRALLNRMRNWSPFSNSSPVEGITRAIRTYSEPGKRVSIYVFGDDVTGPSIQAVIDTVGRINRRRPDGTPSVRIHGIGFPVLFAASGVRAGGIRFATLMRSLSIEHGGAFVALNDVRP